MKKQMIYLFSLVVVLSPVMSCKFFMKTTGLSRVAIRAETETGKSEREDFYYEVPYEVKYGLTIFKVRINDSERPSNFMFDTGANNVISEVLADSLGLEYIDEEVSTDANDNSQRAKTTKIQKLSIGGFNRLGETFSTIDASVFNALDSVRIDGIIGKPVINDVVLYLDPQKKVAVFTHDINNIPDELLTNKIKIEQDWTNLWFAPVHLDGKEYRFLFDTGNNATLTINKETFEKLKNPKLIKRDTTINYTLHGEKINVVSAYTIDEARVGHLVLNTPVTQDNSDLNYLGNGVFDTHYLVVDFDNENIFVTSIE